MIYEVRTYDLRPQSVAEVEERFAAAYESRRRISELGAFFHTEIGPLNQIIQIWPYKDFSHRQACLAAAARLDGWPPRLDEFIVKRRSDIFVPLPPSPALQPGQYGPYFEFRLYTYATEAELPNLIAAWEIALPERLKFGPLTALWRSEIGAENRLLHIWPYRSLDERAAVRKKLRDAGAWPPWHVAKQRGLPGYALLHQENKIVMPAAFSPLK